MELRGGAAPSGWAAPAWSPDGSKIAYIGRGSNVYLLDLATGMSTQVTDDPRDDVESFTFSPDGLSILYNVWRGDAGEIRIVPVAGGESERLVRGDSNAGYPQLSPDGSLLSYSCGDGWPADLCLANADGTDARVLVASSESPGNWSPDGTRIAYWTWPSGVYVVDVATGEVTNVAEGALPTWLDGHILIVEADGCSSAPRPMPLLMTARPHHAANCPDRGAEAMPTSEGGMGDEKDRGLGGCERVSARWNEVTRKEDR